MSHQTDMKRCRTCKHWGDPSDESHGPTDAPRDCSRICHDDRDDIDPEPLAYTMDASDYSSHLCTRPEFGCVLHETGRPGEGWTRREHVMCVRDFIDTTQTIVRRFSKQHTSIGWVGWGKHMGQKLKRSVRLIQDLYPEDE